MPEPNTLIDAVRYFATDDGNANLYDVWAAIDTPVYYVVDEDGVAVADAQVRRLWRDTWLYQDDTDGFALLDTAEVATLCLIPKEDHVPLGWDRLGNVVEL